MIELKVRSFKIKLRHKVALDSQIVYKKISRKLAYNHSSNAHKTFIILNHTLNKKIFVKLIH